MRPRDTSPLLRVMPKDRETEVPRDATVLVTAPRPVDQVAADAVKVRTEDRDVEGVLAISSDGRILAWRPAQVMNAQARHQVTISGVKDARGTLFDEHSSTFVTGVFSYVDFELLSE